MTPASWLFIKGEQSIWIERPYGCLMIVAGPGSSTLPLVVYSLVRRNIEPSINAISTLILVGTTVLIYVADRLGRERAH